MTKSNQIISNLFLSWSRGYWLQPYWPLSGSYR